MIAKILKYLSGLNLNSFMMGLVKLKIIVKFCLIVAITSYFLSSNIFVKTSFDIAPYNSNNLNSSEKNWFVLKTNPGQKLQDSFRITNTSNELINTKIAAKDAKILEDGSFTIIAENETNQNTGNWLNLDVDTIAIEPKKSAQVPVSITVPTDAKDGEYAAGISVLETKPDSESFKVVIRKGLRNYIAVGSDFNLGLKVDKFNIMDPKDPNFEDVKNKKSYFGKDNLLLEFEAENTGNIFGILEAKYALKFENGEVFEGTFNSEIAPNVSKRTYYIITNQSYKTGDTQAILDYQIKPLNIDENKVKIQNANGVVENNLSLNQQELDNFSPAKTKFVQQNGEESTIPQSASTEDNNRLNNWKNIVLIAGIVLLTFGLFGGYFIKRNLAKKSKIKS